MKQSSFCFTFLSCCASPRVPVSTMRLHQAIVELLTVVAVLSVFLSVTTLSSWLPEQLQSSFESSRASCNKTFEVADKNLVVFNAIGRQSYIKYLLHAKRSHFSSWSCIAFTYVGENVIPDNDPDFMQLKEEGCTIIRTPGVQWGVFLQYMPTEFVSSFQHIAIVLDDVFLPAKGKTPINTTKLLGHMDKYNLTSISSAIRGDSHGGMDPYRQGDMFRNCLVEISYIETFLQIFSKAGWECFYQMLHHSGGRGWCYDFCFQKMCGGQHAVDYSMIGYHLELAQQLISNEEADGFIFNGTISPRVRDFGMYAEASLDMCMKNKCGMPNDFRFPVKGKMHCEDTNATQDMHSF